MGRAKNARENVAKDCSFAVVGSCGVNIEIEEFDRCTDQTRQQYTVRGLRGPW